MAIFRSALVKRRSSAALRAVAIAALAASLGGCYTVTESAKLEYPNDYRQRHPITLKEGEHTVEVFVSRNRGGLNPSQRADVLAFAQSWRREATSGIIIEVPRAGGKANSNLAVNDSLREIHSIFAASGVPQNGVRMRPYRPANFTLASIRLNYGKMIADAGPCGRWPDNLGPTDDVGYIENRQYWNFGCANQRNLAAMASNPSDLVQPRGEIPGYAPRRTVVIDKYRKGENPSGTYSGYDTGKISDLGK